MDAVRNEKEEESIMTGCVFEAKPIGPDSCIYVCPIGLVYYTLFSFPLPMSLR